MLVTCELQYLQEVSELIHVGQEAALDAQVCLLTQIAQHLEQQLISGQEGSLQQHCQPVSPTQCLQWYITT